MMRFMTVGPLQILLLAVIALLVFGPKRLPELGKSVGKAIKNFREGINGVEDHSSEKTAESRKSLNKDKPETNNV